MRRRVLIVCFALAAFGLIVARAGSLPTHSSSPHPALKDEPLPPTLARPRTPRQAGVALGLFAEDISFSYAPLLEEIVELGATHVALIVPIYQLNQSSTELFLHTRLSPTLEAVAEAVRESRRAGLDVTLFPIVRLLSPQTPKDWRGTLAPTNHDQWFKSYTERMGELAALGQLTGASRLVIGSELSTLDNDLPRWRKLIAVIRDVFSGDLLYSANWDHYDNTRLFELVDEMGVTAYFKLREPGQPADRTALAQRWRALGKTIIAKLAHYNKPLIFSEVGYRSRKDATLAPWDESSGGTSDLAEQVTAFQAFRQAWTIPGSNAPRLDGLYIWNFYGFGGPHSTSYTPRGKPALGVVREILADLKGR